MRTATGKEDVTKGMAAKVRTNIPKLFILFSFSELSLMLSLLCINVVQFTISFSVAGKIKISSLAPKSNPPFPRVSFNSGFPSSVFTLSRFLLLD